MLFELMLPRRNPFLKRPSLLQFPSAVNSGTPLRACDMQPFPGYKLLPALVPPLPGQAIISYDIVQPQPGCCACGSLSPEGLLLVIVLAFVFWPAALVICCMPAMHLPRQRPLYGSVTTGYAQMPVAYPQPGYPQAANMYGQMGQHTDSDVDSHNQLPQSAQQYSQQPAIPAYGQPQYPPPLERGKAM